MILISHRGNINGPNTKNENNPNYIDSALSKGYDVEIDVWYINDNLFLGHDSPQYSVDFNWFIDRITKLWIHCKNVDSVCFFKESQYPFNFFWHEKDTVTLTSKKFIWVYPGNQPIKNSISVLPEINKEDISHCIGICSDYVEIYI